MLLFYKHNTSVVIRWSFGDFAFRVSGLMHSVVIQLSFVSHTVVSHFAFRVLGSGFRLNV